MPRRNARQRLQKQVVIRRLENIFGNLDSVVPPETSEHFNFLHVSSDEEIVVLAMANIPNVVDIINLLPVSMKNEVLELRNENPPHPEVLRNVVTLINIVHAFRMTKEECQTMFPTCTPKWFGSWFATETSCHGGKVWLPHIQEPEEEQIPEESEGFVTCDEIEPDQEP